MSKRKLENNDFDDLWKKFKEFEKEIAQAQAQRTRHRQHRSDSRLEVPPLLPSRSRSQSPEPSSSSVASSSSSSCSQRGRETPPTRSSLAGLPPPHTPSQEPSRYEDVPSNEVEHIRQHSVTGNAPSPPAPPGSEPQKPLVAELDDELMQVLGEDPSKANTPGKDIQSDLAVRLQYIATSGLSKETRKELLSKYLLPGNCTLINAPDLNAEVKAAIPDTIYKRDQGIKTRQKQTATATSCLAEALTMLLSAETRNMILIKLLMDASRLLCDTQYQDSVTRRNFILYNLKKDVKEQLQATKVDKYLFSQGLADTLKAAKTISKSGADLKQSISTQQTQKKTDKGKNHLNWRASLPHHRQSTRPAPPPPPPPPPTAPRVPPRAHR
ncbi:uncharacterized protein LOC123723079 [Papilio machaon]|uniref:uncharacterized protein LOC123723079 n=1 Tax=Papilio machaon TaxID=76193 RepID=UPI001E66573C|nr:uncharacterized protein LOC123723079 [Papilio machaon]